MASWIPLVVSFGLVSTTTLDVNIADQGCITDRLPPSLSKGRTDSLVIVSTLDGKLTALNANAKGAIHWSLPSGTGPLFSSSLTDYEFRDTSGPFRVVPSLDGTLFQWRDDKLRALPVNVNSLLSSSFKLSDGLSFVGSNEILSYGMDPRTGKLHYVCTAEGCRPFHSEQKNLAGKDILLVKRRQHNVRAIDSRVGSERWNFSVGQLDLSLEEGDEAVGNAGMCQQSDSIHDEHLRLSAPDGLVAAFDKKDGAVLWSHKFPSPVASVWTLHGARLRSWNLFAEEMIGSAMTTNMAGANPSLFLGNNNGHMYIQTSSQLSQLVQLWTEELISELDPGSSQSSRWALLSRSSPEFQVTAPELRLPAMPSSQDVTTTSLAVHQHLEIGSYYYSTMPMLQCGDVPFSGESMCFRFRPDSNISAVYLVTDNSFSVWWKEVTLLVLGCSLLVGAFVKVYERRKKAAALARVTAEVAAAEQERLSKEFLTRSSDADDKRLPEDSPMKEKEGSIPEYFSRYDSDFEEIKCLGKGAFGRVFKVKKRLDDQEYAVKRVRLPENKDARLKVMREVKALAQLDHSNIVRYFNSWMERAPANSISEGSSSLDELDASMESTSSVAGKASLVHVNMQHSHFKKLNCAMMECHNGSLTSGQVSGSSGLSPNNDSFCIEFRNVLLTAGQASSSGHLPNNDSFDIEFRSSSTEPATCDNIQAGDSDSGCDGGHAPSHYSRRKPLFSIGESRDHNPLPLSGQSRKSERRKSEHRSLKHSSSSESDSPAVYLYIQMQLCRERNLKDWLVDNMERHHPTSLNIFLQISRAVEYVHRHGLMHRDLKPSNVFFSHDGSVKVGDFGLARAFGVQKVTSTSNLRQLEGDCNSDDDDHTGQVGTEIYMSPELREGRTYCQKVDIFSLGIILFELLHPFGTEAERVKVLLRARSGRFPEEFVLDMSNEAGFVSSLLSHHPNQRPRASEICRHQILKRVARQDELNASLQDIS